MTPTDIIANAIHDASCGCGSPSDSNRDLAGVVADALTQDVVIIHAARALEADTATRPASPLAGAELTTAQYQHIARVVLRSVAGGA